MPRKKTKKSLVNENKFQIVTDDDEIFPQKLWKFVNSTKNTVVNWNRSGDRILLNMSALENYFSANANGDNTFTSENSTSIVRKLSLYGFKQNHEFEKRCSGNSIEIQEYVHPHFKRNCADDLKYVQLISVNSAIKALKKQEPLKDTCNENVIPQITPLEIARDKLRLTLTMEKLKKLAATDNVENGKSTTSSDPLWNLKVFLDTRRYTQIIEYVDENLYVEFYKDVKKIETDPIPDYVTRNDCYPTQNTIPLSDEMLLNEIPMNIIEEEPVEIENDNSSEYILPTIADESEFNGMNINQEYEIQVNELNLNPNDGGILPIDSSIIYDASDLICDYSVQEIENADVNIEGLPQQSFWNENVCENLEQENPDQQKYEDVKELESFLFEEVDIDSIGYLSQETIQNVEEAMESFLYQEIRESMEILND